MHLRTSLVVLVLVFGLSVGSSTAQAAKGVKKGKTGEHHHHGKVISVDHKAGTITIQETHHAKKKSTAGKTTGAKGSTSTYDFKVHVSKNTKFFSEHGKKKTPSNFGAVKVGEHVLIASHNDHADSVTILHKAKKGNKKKK